MGDALPPEDIAPETSCFSSSSWAVLSLCWSSFLKLSYTCWSSLERPSALYSSCTSGVRCVVSGSAMVILLDLDFVDMAPFGGGKRAF